MTDLARRAILAGIAIAPAVAAAPIAAASPRADLLALDSDALLAHGAAHSADPVFADLCARAAALSERESAAWDLFHDARVAADAATPDYPAGLRYRCRFTPKDGPDAGQTREWEERCEPDGEHRAMLWNMAWRRASETGVNYREAEGQLRAEFAAWRAAKEAAEAHYLTDELETAADAVSAARHGAMDAIYAHPARNAGDMLVKMRLARDEGEPSAGPVWSTVLSDVERFLAA